MEFKVCNVCQIEKHITLYEINKKGRRSICKTCRTLQMKQRKQARYKEEKIQVTEKVCRGCNTSLHISNYNKDMINKDGYDHYCKACVKINRKKKQERKVTVSSDVIASKFCKLCNKNKEVVHFKSTNKSSDGYYHTCNECWKPKEWNKEKERESHRKYAIKNPDKIKEKYKRQSKNINRRMRNSMTKRIIQAMQAKKCYKTVKYIGCDIAYLRKWIEYQFEENMTFDNYGEWHIDHVTPCASYNLDNNDDVFACFNWTNLRPCWAKDNIIKGDKVIPELIKKQKEKVTAFLNINPLPTQPGDRVEGTE